MDLDSGAAVGCLGWMSMLRAYAGSQNQVSLKRYSLFPGKQVKLHPFQTYLALTVVKIHQNYSEVSPGICNSRRRRTSHEEPLKLGVVPDTFHTPHRQCLYKRERPSSDPK